MGDVRETMQTIRMDFGNVGLHRTRASALSDESSLRNAENVTTDFRGVLRKAGTFKPQGEPIVEPTTAAGTEDGMVSIALPINKADWAIASKVENNATTEVGDGKISVYATANTFASSGHSVLRRSIMEGEEYNSDSSWDGSFTIGFRVHAPSLYPSTPGNYSSVGLHLAAAVANDKLVYIAIGQAGLYCMSAAGTYSLLPGTEWFAIDGLPHYIELKYILLGGTYYVSCVVDGTLVVANVNLGASPFAATDNQWVDVKVVNASGFIPGVYIAASISNIVLRDTATSPTQYPIIRSAFSRYKYRESSDSRDLRTYVATDAYLWANDQLSNVWNPVLKLPLPSTAHTDFRDSVILSNYGTGRETYLYQIDKNYGLTKLLDAPFVKFLTTRNNRLYGAGDLLYPLRLYYSADRDPATWFSPDTDSDGEETYDEVLTAGYFEIDGKSGDEIRAIWGEFLDSTIVATNRQLFRITGTDHTDWHVERISNSIGALGPHCIEQAGTDLWIVSDSGIYSLRGIAEHGDMATSMLSSDLQEVFISMGDMTDEILPQLSEHVRLVHDANTQSMLLFIPTADQTENKIYSCNLATGKWLGPWVCDISTLEVGIAGWPQKARIISGNSDGEMTAMFNYDSPDVAVTMESQVLTGRSIDPKLVGMEKVWKNFRLMYIPTGAWNATFSFKAEDRDWISVTKPLCSSLQDTIGTDWVVGTSEVEGSDELHFLDFTIDIKSRTLKWRLTFSGGSMSQLACELEFVPSGYERGD